MPSLALWQSVLGDWLAQDRALRAYEAKRAGRSTEGIEELAQEDEAWLANDLPQVLRKRGRLGMEEDGKAVFDAVVRAYRTTREKATRARTGYVSRQMIQSALALPEAASTEPVHPL